MNKRAFGLSFSLLLLGGSLAWAAPPILPATTASITSALATTTQPLQDFGYDVFQGQVAITEGPIDEDYVVGPRDVLLIQTWGEYTKQYPVTVSENGDFYLEGEEQRIFVNGLTLRQVQMEVTRRLAQTHKEYFNWQRPFESRAWVEVRTIKVRPLLVYVVGEVVQPKTVSLNSNVASLINVLSAAGVKPTGSLRRIRVSRTSGTSELIDLYDFLIRGDTRPVRTRLKYGETVFVDIKRKGVEVRGSVRRPARYEMLDTESLRDLIEYAGGPAPGAYLKRVQIIRRALNEGTRTLDVDFAALSDKGSTIPLLDGDRVEVFPSVEEEHIVTLEGGGVFRPGTYQFTDGMTLADVIEKAEGLRGQAYLDKADLIRTRLDFTKEYKSFSLKELYRQNPATGRVELIGEKTNPLNFPLQRLDKIVIYSYFEIIGKDKKVQLAGYVKQPGEYLLAEKMKISDLLFAYGGFEDPDWRRATYQERLDIIRTRPEDLRTTRIAVSLRRVLEGDPQADIPLQSMDQIIVYSYDEIIKKDRFVQLEGHVKKAGPQPLSENMRLSDLLFAFGGFEDLDFRKATYMERADLYRINPNDLSVTNIPIQLGKVLAGDRPADLPLQSLDRIVVYEYKQFYPDSSFTIYGAVRNPGKYTLAQNTTLNDAIVMASGLLEEADYEAEIVRTSPEKVSALQPAEVFHVRISKDYVSEAREKAFRLMKDDAVFVRTVPGWIKPQMVRITGEVQFPGDYVLANADERAAALVERARGLKTTAYLPGAVFTRRIDHSTTFSTHIRVAIHLTRALARPGGPDDLILRDGDEIRVPTNPMTVEVRGAVHAPAVLQYQRGRGVNYYIAMCGGYRREALRRDVLTLNPDGTTTRRGWGWFEPEPLPGAVIVVPPYSGQTEEGTVPVPSPLTVGSAPVSIVQVPRPRELSATMAGRMGQVPSRQTIAPAAAPTSGTVVVQNIIAPPAAEKPSTTSTFRLEHVIPPPTRPAPPLRLPIP